jgi:hypothetical protein
MGQITAPGTQPIIGFDSCAAYCCRPVVYCICLLDQDAQPQPQNPAEPMSVLVSPAPVPAVEETAVPETAVVPTSPMAQSARRRLGFGNNAGFRLRGGLLDRMLNRRR